MINAAGAEAAPHSGGGKSLKDQYRWQLWIIVAVNTPWEHFAQDNAPGAPAVPAPTSVGSNYLHACRGDTSGKVLKPAKLKTGFMVQVPLFCATGDKIEIDTRTGEYRRRV